MASALTLQAWKPSTPRAWPSGLSLAIALVHCCSPPGGHEGPSWRGSLARSPRRSRVVQAQQKAQAAFLCIKRACSADDHSQQHSGTSPRGVACMQAAIRLHACMHLLVLSTDTPGTPSSPSCSARLQFYSDAACTTSWLFDVEVLGTAQVAPAKLPRTIYVKLGPAGLPLQVVTVAIHLLQGYTSVQTMTTNISTTSDSNTTSYTTTTYDQTNTTTYTQDNSTTTYWESSDSSPPLELDERGEVSYTNGTDVYQNSTQNSNYTSVNDTKPSTATNSTYSGEESSPTESSPELEPLPVAGLDSEQLQEAVQQGMAQAAALVEQVLVSACCCCCPA